METAAVKALEDIHQMMGVVESFELLRTGVPLDDVVTRTGTSQASLARVGAIIENKKGKVKVNQNFDAASILERLRQRYMDAMEADIDESFVKIEKASRTQLSSIAAEMEKSRANSKGLNMLIRPTETPEDLFTPFSGPGTFALLDRNRTHRGMPLSPGHPAIPSVPPRKTQGPQLRRVHEREMNQIQHKLRKKVEERSREVAVKLPTEVKPMLRKGLRPKKARPVTDAWYRSGHLHLILAEDPVLSIERTASALSEGLRTVVITATAPARFRSAHRDLSGADLVWLTENAADEDSVSPTPSAVESFLARSLDKSRLISFQGLGLMLSIHEKNEIVAMLESLSEAVSGSKGVILAHVARERLEPEHWQHLEALEAVIVEDTAAPLTAAKKTPAAKSEDVKKLEKALVKIGVRRMQVTSTGPQSFHIAYNPDDLYFLTSNDIQFELKEEFNETIFELSEDSSIT